MPTEIAAVLVHPAAHRASHRSLARRGLTLGGELVLAAAIVAGGTVAVLMLLLTLVVAAPLAAIAVCWLFWRSGDRAAREARRVRARLRRRARALGLVVLAGSQPALVRLAAVGVRPPPRAPDTASP